MSVCKLCFKEESTIAASLHNVEEVVKIHFPFIHERIIDQSNKISPMMCDHCWKVLEDFNAFHKIVEKIYSGFFEPLDEEFPETQFKNCEQPEKRVKPCKQVVKPIKQEEVISTRPTRKRPPRRAAGDAILEIEFAEPPPEIEKEEIEKKNDKDDNEDDMNYKFPLLKGENSAHYREDKDWNEFSSGEEIPTTKRESKPRRSKPGSDALYEIEFQEYQPPLKYKRTEEEELDLANYDKIIRDYLNIKCMKCPADRFNTYSDLKDHYKSEHPTHNQRRVFVHCDCGRKFTERNKLAPHIKLHLDPNAFQCHICQRRLSHPGSLREHMAIHNRPPPEMVERVVVEKSYRFKCGKCPKRFKAEESLDNHMVKHMTLNCLKYHCDICKKRYPNKKLLIRHMILHQQALASCPAICNYCGLVLKNNSNLKYHILKHEDPEGYSAKVQCEECGKWVRNGSGLRSHMAKHRNQMKKHVCSRCGKAVASASSLKRHIDYVHVMKRTHQCRFCEKAFKKPFELTEHESTHTGDTKIQCSICSMKFNCLANMYAHKKRVHADEWRQEKLAGIPEIAQKDVTF